MSKMPKYFKVEVGRKGAGIKVTPIFDDDNIVEVVRCKDCKYYDTEDNYCDRDIVNSLLTTEPSDFCSWGIRRKSNE